MTEPNEGNGHKEKRVKTIQKETHQGLDARGLRQGEMKSRHYNGFCWFSSVFQFPVYIYSQHGQ